MDDFRWLIAREIPYLRRCARALTRDREVADDIVQDTMERALRKRRLWRFNGSLRAWLYRMMYNLYLNRSERPAVERFAVPADEAPERAMPASQDKRVECRTVVAALNELPLDQRDAIILTGLEGLSYDEAAFILDIPVGTLRSRVHRGRETLRRIQRGRAGAATIRRVK